VLWNDEEKKRGECGMAEGYGRIGDIVGMEEKHVKSFSRIGEGSLLVKTHLAEFPKRCSGSSDGPHEQ
jgi:hypothetical protein